MSKIDVEVNYELGPELEEAIKKFAIRYHSEDAALAKKELVVAQERIRKLEALLKRAVTESGRWGTTWADSAVRLLKG